MTYVDESLNKVDNYFYFDKLVLNCCKIIGEKHGIQVIYSLTDSKFIKVREDMSVNNMKVLNKVNESTYENIKYAYSLEQREEKLRITCRNIVIHNYNGGVCFEKLVTSVVFNMKTGFTYILGNLSSQGKKLRKFNEKRYNGKKSIKNITYFESIGSKIREKIWLPNTEWERAYKMIKKYKQELLKNEFEQIYSIEDMHKHEKLKYLMNFNRHPLLKHNTVQNLNMKVNNKNLLAYLNQNTTEETYKKDFIRNLNIKCSSKLEPKEIGFLYLYNTYSKSFGAYLNEDELVYIVEHQKSGYINKYPYLSYIYGRIELKVPLGFRLFIRKITKDMNNIDKLKDEIKSISGSNFIMLIENYYELYKRLKNEDESYKHFSDDFYNMKLDDLNSVAKKIKEFEERVENFNKLINII